MTEPDKPIEDVLDDLIPDWREQTHKLSDEGKTDAEIAAEFQRQIKAQIDPLLDFYNTLKRKGPSA